MAKVILVIEDEKLIREDISRILSLNDYEVIEAENGEVGIELAKKHIPDLIISDIMMPKVDGFGVLKTLQESEKTATIPFLFLTARSTRDDIREGMNFGADDYITKPFDLLELINAVRSRIAKYEKQTLHIDKKFEELKSSIHFTIPHEIRTPLISILGFSDLLIKNYDRISKDNALEMLKDINSEGKRLNKLFENFLLYAELEIVAFKPLEISKLHQKVTRIASTVAQDTVFSIASQNERNEDIVFDFEEADLIMDQSHFAKINECLIENACKFSNKGTKIIVSSVVTDNNFFRLKYKDFGKGMSENEIKNIDAYIQHNRKEWEQQGAGMGLALVRKIAEIYNGSCTIESILDEYTQVSVDIPIYR